MLGEALVLFILALKISEMESHHDTEHLRRQYLAAYEEAIRRKLRSLPSYMEDWHKTLNEIELKLFNDIRSIGARLYPYFPVGKYNVDFANPFAKIAVLIKYKKSNLDQLNEKSKYLRGIGWLVFLMESKAVTHSAEALYEMEYKRHLFDIAELEYDDFMDFITKYSDTNSECLVYLIKEKCFDILSESQESEFEDYF